MRCCSGAAAGEVAARTRPARDGGERSTERTTTTAAVNRIDLSQPIPGGSLHGTPRPPLENTGDDYVAIFESLVANLRWLSENPDPALISEIFVPGTPDTTTGPRVSVPRRQRLSLGGRGLPPGVGRSRRCAGRSRVAACVRQLEFERARRRGRKPGRRNGPHGDAEDLTRALAHDDDDGRVAYRGAGTRADDGRSSCEDWLSADLRLLVVSRSPASRRMTTLSRPPSAGGGVSADAFFVGIIAPGQPGFVSADDPNGAAAVHVHVGAVRRGRVRPTEPQCGGLRRGRHAVHADRPRPRGRDRRHGGALRPARGEPVPALPQVPTIGEIWRAAMRNIPGPKAGINPRPTGLTGLETWLWYEGPQELGGQRRASARSPSPAPRASARSPSTWATASPSPRRTGLGGGAGGTVRLRDQGHLRDRRSPRRWTADLVLTGPGLTARPTPIGTAVAALERAYPVQEVRGLLVD